MPDRELKSQIRETKQTITFILCHAAAMGVFFVAGFLLQDLLIALGDPKLYDTVPWRYVVDTMDLGTVLMLAMNIVRLIKKMGRGR